MPGSLYGEILTVAQPFARTKRSLSETILLARLASDQVKALADKGVAISTIEFAAASPAITDNSDFADAIAAVLNTDKVLIRRRWTCSFRMNTSRTSGTCGKAAMSPVLLSRLSAPA